MIRGIIFWIIFVVFSYTFSSLIILVSPFFVWYKSGQEFLHHCTRWWGQAIFRATPGVKVKVIKNFKGYNDLGPVVFVSNHTSNFDVFTVCFLDANFRWLSKDTLFKLPIIGWAMRIVGYVPVVRKSAMSRSKCLQNSKNHLISGVSMFFFPEGTRSRNGELGKFKLGAFRLAKEMSLPIVPVTIQGACEVCPSGSFKVNSGTILLTIGDPIFSNENTLEQLAEKAFLSIEKTLKG